jgi:hypothetical protein
MSTADDRPILLRRQNRPAPSCGPKFTPRPPATGPQPTVASEAIDRNRPVRKCDRCHRQTGDYRWSAASRCAEKFHAELSLCAGCLHALRSFLAGYENKVRQKAAAKNQGATSCPMT